MTDQTQAVATRPVREVRVVDDAIPVLDTARFEQMQRISTAIAQGSLIPETLRGVHQGSGANRQLVPFDMPTIVANVFRVVNQAVRWNADPFSVIDCCSVVHGRLMYEGKLVHAIIESRVGLRLNYRFGKMVDGRFDGSEEGKGEALAIQVFAKYDDEETERTIEGSVAEWKTTGNQSPWGNPSAHRRMLRYRGTREWARAHSPSVLLGVVTDDEIEADADRQVTVASARRGTREKADLRGKLEGPQAQAGFDASHVARETGPKPEDDDQTAGDAHDEVTGEVIEGKAEEVQPQEEREETTDKGEASDVDETETETAEQRAESLRKTAYDDGYDGEPVQAVLSECDDDAEKALAAAAHAEGVAARAADDEKAAADQKPATADFDITHEGGPAPKGSVYLLSSDEPGEDDKLPTYKDGQTFSRVGSTGAKKLKAYDAHPEPADPALASQGDGVGQAEQVADDEPKGGLYQELAAMDSWLAIKPRLSAIYAEDDFKALEPADQAAVRANLFGAVVEMKDRTRDPVDWATDVSCFVLWLDHTAAKGGKDGAEAIEGTFDVLKNSAGWAKLNEGQRGTIESRAAAAIQKLRGA